MKVASLVRLLYRRFAKHDLDAGMYILDKIGRVLVPEYRYRNPMDWWTHPEFSAYLARFGEAGSDPSADRRWNLAQLLRLTRDIPGDTAECGVFRGAGSYLIARTNIGTSKTHHVFDSFEGVSEPGARDGHSWSKGQMACGLPNVQRALADLPSVRYYQGWIPARFPEVADRMFSFVHVDVDLEQPSVDSLRFFYDRLSPGAILVCDDYGFSSTPGVAVSMDEFLAGRPEKMLTMSGGAGFLIKGRPVAPLMV
jgi:O-methyltransferase